MTAAQQHLTLVFPIENPEQRRRLLQSVAGEWSRARNEDAITALDTALDNIEMLRTQNSRLHNQLQALQAQQKP